MKIIQIAMFLLVFNLACFMLVQTGGFKAGTVPPELQILTAGASATDTTISLKMNNTTTFIANPATSLSPLTSLAGGIWFGIEFFFKIVVNAPSTFAFLVTVIIPGNEPIETTISIAILAITWIIYLSALIQLLSGRTWTD